MTSPKIPADTVPPPATGRGSPLRIAIAVGEASGDLLGANLMLALHERAVAEGRELQVFGIAGPRMIEQGVQSWYPAEKLAVWGLWDFLKRVRKIFALRREFRDRLLADRPDLFIGIDAPDFNFRLERWMKQAGIPAIHYVSPSVWAWRPKRIPKIRASVDLILALFPFEKAFYQGHDIPVEFVGHPLADRLDPPTGQAEARAALGLDADARLLCVMPGSRSNEMDLIGPVFVETMAWLHARHPDWRFVAPMANTALQRRFESMLEGYTLPVTLLDGQSHLAMSASDGALQASGTATLEALLLERPMVVAYRMPWLSWKHFSHSWYVPWVSLANHIMGREVAAEFLQHEAVVDNIGPAVEAMLQADNRELRRAFALKRAEMRGDASRAAAEVIWRRFVAPRAVG